MRRKFTKKFGRQKLSEIRRKSQDPSENDLELGWIMDSDNSEILAGNWYAKTKNR